MSFIDFVYPSLLQVHTAVPQGHAKLGNLLWVGNGQGHTDPGLKTRWWRGTEQISWRLYSGFGRKKSIFPGLPSSIDSIRVRVVVKAARSR
jgi:hypothetical protein